MAKRKLRVVTLNVNGIRSCLKKGLATWLAEHRPTIACLQEIRARPEDLGDWADGPPGYHCYWQPAQRPGYAGVAILSRIKPSRVETLPRAPLMNAEGRWLAAHYADFVVVSCYLPSGTSGAERQQVKYACMQKAEAKMARWARDGGRYLVCGDINIAHTKADIRNWRANQKNSGFLPAERAWLDKLLGPLGWVDVFRAKESRTFYSWWSQRGGARERDVGWRIDYQLATPAFAATAKRARIHKEPLLSDHAPVVIDYEF